MCMSDINVRLGGLYRISTEFRFAQKEIPYKFFRGHLNGAGSIHIYIYIYIYTYDSLSLSFSLSL